MDSFRDDVKCILNVEFKAIFTSKMATFITLLRNMCIKMNMGR